MGFNRLARGITLAAILTAGSAVAEETEAERCAGFPVAAEDTVVDYKDKLAAYTAERYQYHLDNGDNKFIAGSKSGLDAAFCADRAEGIVDGARDLGEDLIDRGGELLEDGKEFLDELLEEPPPPPLGEPV